MQGRPLSARRPGRRTLIRLPCQLWAPAGMLPCAELRGGPRAGEGLQRTGQGPPGSPPPARPNGQLNYLLIINVPTSKAGAARVCKPSQPRKDLPLFHPVSSDSLFKFTNHTRLSTNGKLGSFLIPEMHL